MKENLTNSLDCVQVRAVLGKVFRREVDPERLFSLSDQTSTTTRELLCELLSPACQAVQPGLAWTRDLTRLAVLTARAWQHQEPVLLVGETGCGKTSVVQALAGLRGVKLHSLSCHANTEAADLLGGLRPGRAGQAGLFHWQDGPLVRAMREGAVFLADEISLAEDSVLERMNSVLEPERAVLLAEKVG